ncbi:MAG: hypothetical protein HY812_03455 [Planctomycetes bacterium]|nr:hypothetical protein [Planctomycetota bacterium]
MRHLAPDAAVPARWSVVGLLVCNLLAGLLLGSWLCPSTRIHWEHLDRAAFHLLNGSLDGPGWWQVAWAAANHRLFDLVPAVLTLAIICAFVFAGDRRQMVRRAAAGVAVALFILLVRKLAGLDVLDIHRHSPTRVVSGAIRLSKVVPWISSKDASTQSFLGDHCVCLLMLTGFFWYYGGVAWGLCYAAFTAVFSLPRLVSGAHWLTDDLVGSGSIALASMSLLLATPLHGFFERLLMPAAGRLLRRWQSGPDAPESG